MSNLNMFWKTVLLIAAGIIASNFYLLHKWQAELEEIVKPSEVAKGMPGVCTTPYCEEEFKGNMVLIGQPTAAPCPSEPFSQIEVADLTGQVRNKGYQTRHGHRQLELLVDDREVRVTLMYDVWLWIELGATCDHGCRPAGVGAIHDYNLDGCVDHGLYSYAPADRKPLWGGLDLGLEHHGYWQGWYALVADAIRSHN